MKFFRSEQRRSVAAFSIVVSSRQFIRFADALSLLFLQNVNGSTNVSLRPFHKDYSVDVNVLYILALLLIFFLHFFLLSSHFFIFNVREKRARIAHIFFASENYCCLSYWKSAIIFTIVWNILWHCRFPSFRSWSFLLAFRCLQWHIVYEIAWFFCCNERKEFSDWLFHILQYCTAQIAFRWRLDEDRYLMKIKKKMKYRIPNK